MTTALEQRAEELRAIVSQPSEREQAARELAAVEARLAEEAKAAAKADAVARIVAIKRAYPSLLLEYERDQTRVRQRTAELSAAIATVNERYEKLVALELEARDLGKDFNLPTPDFTNLKSTERVQAPADLLRGMEPEARPLDMTDYIRLVRAHEHRREGPARTRYDAVRADQ